VHPKRIISKNSYAYNKQENNPDRKKRV